MRSRNLRRAALTALCLPGCLPGNVAAETVCLPLAHRVSASNPTAEAALCDDVRAAVVSLASCDVTVPGTVEIAVVEELPEKCLALFHCGKSLIEILPREVMAERQPFSALFAPLDPDVFYRSVIVHELTHATFDATPCPPPGCTATAEYLAYAMQVRFLNADERALIGLEERPITPVDDLEINAVIWGLAPDVFVRKSWAHFMQREAPCAFARQLFDRLVVFDFDMP